MNPYPKPSTRAPLVFRTATLALSAFALGIAGFYPAAWGDVAVTPATAPATRPSFKHPAADAAARFQVALARGDAEAAVRATAHTAKPLAGGPKMISTLIVRMKNDKTPFIVHDVQADGDLAVAIVGKPARVGDKTFESDIWFLVREAGEWRVLPDCNSYNRAEYGFDANRLEAYKKLEERAEERTGQLRLEITGCSC